MSPFNNKRPLNRQLPLMVNEYIAFSSLPQLLKKTLISLMPGTVGPAIMIGYPPIILVAALLSVFALRMMNNLETEMLYTVNASPLPSHIITLPDVDTSDNTIPNHECVLPEQQIFNSNCKIRNVDNKPFKKVKTAKLLDKFPPAEEVEETQVWYPKTRDSRI